MAKKRKNIKKLDVNGKSYNEKDIEKLFAKHRVNILSKYVDKYFTSNVNFKQKIEAFMDGNIKTEIMKALDDEFSVMKDDPDDKVILDMINKMVEDFIEKTYP